MTTSSQTVTAAAPRQVVAQPKTGRPSNLLARTAQYTILIILGITWLFPLFWMVSSALKDDPQVYTVPPSLLPSPAYWNNFYDAWHRLDFTQATFNSVFLYSIPVTLLTVVSSVVVAYGFAKIKWPGREALFWVCIATMMLPWQVTMVPLFIIYKELGWINTYLPLVIPAMFGNAYFVFLLRQFFLTLPEELSESARLEGASELGILWRIILPLSKPALAVVILFRFLWSWNDYLGPLIYINQENLQPLALMIYRLRTIATGMGTSAMAYPHLMAVSTLVALPIILAFVLAQRTFIEGISMTGLKG